MKEAFAPESSVIMNRPLTLYHCGYEQCKPSHYFGPAIRPHYLFHYILSGHGTYDADGITYHLKKGDGFLITPGVSTLYSADEMDPWEYCWIGFDGYDVTTILKHCSLSVTNLIFTDNSNGLLRNHLLTLIENFTEGLGNDFTYLGELYLCFSHMYQTVKKSEKHIYEALIRKALDYIHNNYTYDIKIADVAKFLSIDRTYLYKLFVAEQKVSPQQYLIRYRLNVSQKLLKESDLSVTEIAYSCGFRDAPSFNKHFKKQFFITPLQYRSSFL
ncbi:MAG: AraC family transcriptional regulator [Herbinix sp.]|jgi:AraC-like DNA-binding protein|nr:AraC family transcriptional regulator [Herbinix sp.]